MNRWIPAAAARPLAALALMASGIAMAEPPSVRYVRAEAPDGGDGQSWATAYNLIRAALAEAEASGGAITEIWVKEGSYRPLYILPEGVNLSFTLVSGVGLYGGFDGTETQRDQRDPAAHPTILNGDLGGVYVNQTVTGAGDSTAVLDGFTIKNAPYGERGGRGLLITQSPTIRNCIIRDCSGGSYPTFMVWTGGGGVVCIPGSAGTLIGCTITDNNTGSSWAPSVSPRGGAGVHATNCSVHLIDCVISNNRSGWGGFSGACQGGRPEGGNNGAPGAGLYLESASVLLEGCTISGNLTGSATAAGGCMQGSAPGTRSGDGGAMYALSSEVVAVNCLIADNHTGTGGIGGIAMGLGLKGGDSGNGAAVWASGGSVELVNCTLADNAVGAGGPGGMSATGFPPGALGNPGAGAGLFGDSAGRIDNSISWNGGVSEIVGAVTISYSDIQGGYTGTGNINADPFFVHAPSGNYRLAGSSPCIDAANSLVDIDPFTPGTQPLPAQDLAGLARRVDIASVPDTGVGAPVVDMGAYEVQACVVDLNGDGLVDFSDYLEFLNLFDAGDLRVDFTGDGIVDFSDYLEFLNLYEAGC